MLQYKAHYQIWVRQTKASRITLCLAMFVWSMMNFHWKLP